MTAQRAHDSVQRAGGSRLLDRGAFLLSLDMELAWGGVHRSGIPSRDHLYAGTRPAVERLLQLLERYSIHATWAIVGHLFLRGCQPVEGRKHPELIRPEYAWFRGDWLDADPGSVDPLAEPHWYAPDIIERILECPTKQEVGCHTFSHILADDPGCSAECFRSELEACRRVAAEWGIDLTSFVYPRNGIAHVDVLAQEGFRAFRGTVEPAWSRPLPSPVKRALGLLRWILPIPPLTARPKRVDGVWNLPATCFYLHREGHGRVVPVQARVHRVTRGIHASIREASTSHLYLHPFNLAGDPEGLLGGLESIFELVAQLRGRDALINPTMGELAQRLDSACADDPDEAGV